MFSWAQEKMSKFKLFGEQNICGIRKKRAKVVNLCSVFKAWVVFWCLHISS